jgi:recombinational DNA repair protein (RecF pathway)
MGAASVVAELVLRHAGEEANPTLFEGLESALDGIGRAADPDVLPLVLSETWRLVSALGYRPVLDACVGCGEALDSDEMGRFDFPAGGLRCLACGGERGPRVGPGARAQLRALLSGEALPEPLTRGRAHLQLLSDFVTYHVSGSRPLISFTFLAGMLPDDA